VILFRFLSSAELWRQRHRDSDRCPPSKSHGSAILNILCRRKLFDVPAFIDDKDSYLEFLPKTSFNLFINFRYIGNRRKAKPN